MPSHPVAEAEQHAPSDNSLSDDEIPIDPFLTSFDEPMATSPSPPTLNPLSVGPPTSTFEMLARDRPIPAGKAQPLHYSPSFFITSKICALIQASNPRLEQHLVGLRLREGQHPDPLATDFSTLSLSGASDSINDANLGSEPGILDAADLVKGVVYGRTAYVLRKDLGKVLADLKALQPDPLAKTGVTLTGKTSCIKTLNHIDANTSSWSPTCRVYLHYLGETISTARHRWTSEDKASAPQQALSTFLRFVRTHRLVQSSSRDVILAVVGPTNSLEAEGIVANVLGFTSSNSFNVSGCGRSVSAESQLMLCEYSYSGEPENSQTITGKRCSGVAFDSKNHIRLDDEYTQRTDESSIAIEIPTCSSNFMPLSMFDDCPTGLGGRYAACSQCRRLHVCRRVAKNAAEKEATMKGLSPIEVLAVGASAAVDYVYKSMPNRTKQALASNNKTDKETGITTKTCLGPCGRTLPLTREHFGLHVNGTAGFASRCYRCMALRENPTMDTTQFKHYPCKTKAGIAARDSTDAYGVKWRICSAPRCRIRKVLNNSNFRPVRNAFGTCCIVCLTEYDKARYQRKKEFKANQHALILDTASSTK